MSKILPLFKHQIQSVQTFLKNPIGFDGSDPGTGKTRVQIETFSIRRRKGAGAALIIAPKSLLDPAWGDDIKKFAPHLSISVAHARNREAAFQKPADVYITNTDATKWLAKQPASFFERFSTLVIDESSAFKHHTSQRSKALEKIKKHFEFRYALSGTPNSNSITDIWNQVRFLDNGQRLGPVFFKFRENVCRPQQVGPQPNMLKWEPRDGAEEAIANLIADITVRHKFEDVNTDVPENFQYERHYRLSHAQMKAYQQMEKDAVAELQNGLVTAVNAASVMTKLLQIASGAVYDGSGQYQLVDTGRYEMIGDLVEERKHSLVFFHWAHQRDELIKEMNARKITYAVIDGKTSDKDRMEAVRLFQSGFYRVLLAHPQSAAHGLTLTRATTTIWASPTYNLEHFLQGNRRIYRTGQTQKTETIVILAEDTIEGKVLEKLTTKKARQFKTLDLLQGLFEDIAQ
jgi:SNF2 family DNA or RNA helicase